MFRVRRNYHRSKKRWRTRGGLARSWLGSVWSWAHLKGYGYATGSCDDKSSTTCTRYEIDSFTVVILITYFLSLHARTHTHTHTHTPCPPCTNNSWRVMAGEGLYNHIHTSFLKIEYDSWTAKRISSLNLLAFLCQKQGVGRCRCSSSQLKA
jgi:hypothetical protein